MRRLHATTWRDSRGVPAASRHWFSATRHRVAAGSTDVREGARMPTDDNAGADRIGLAGRTTTAFGVPGAAVMAAVDEIVVHQLLLASLPRPVHHRRRAGVGRGTAHDRGGVGRIPAVRRDGAPQAVARAPGAARGRPPSVRPGLPYGLAWSGADLVLLAIGGRWRCGRGVRLVHGVTRDRCAASRRDTRHRAETGQVNDGRGRHRSSE